MQNRILDALRKAEGIVTQHNLLSTATLGERLDTISRHINWWDRTALPIIEAIEGQEVISVVEVNLHDLLDYDVPDKVPEWEWVRCNARFAHVGNGKEPGVYEFFVSVSTQFSDAERLATIPNKLRPFFETAIAIGAPWVIFHQG